MIYFIEILTASRSAEAMSTYTTACMTTLQKHNVGDSGARQRANLLKLDNACRGLPFKIAHDD